MQKKTLIVNDTNFLAFRDMIREINLSENSIIVVPDKFSLSAEKMIFEEKNILATFSTQVFSITKLASKVLEDKLKDKKLIDKNISLMIISSIINENLHNFKYFKNVKDINHLTSDIFNVVSQMLSSDIKEFNKELSGNLKDKFDDLLLILNNYVLKREEILIDASKKYDLFLSEIKNSDFIKDKNFYFGMFTSMTSQVKSIIKEITKQAKSVCFAGSFSENRVNNNEIFNFYKSFNPNIKKGTSKLNKVSSFIEKNFFTSRSEKLEIKDKVKLFEAKSIDEEIDNLILEIKKDILLENKRFKDISVCLSSIEKYKDNLISKFDDNNINYFLDCSIKLNENSYAKFILALINVLINTTNSNVLSLIKNSYLNIEEKIKNNFERFLEKYSLINGYKLLDFDCFKSDELYTDYIFIYNNIVKKLEDFKDSLKNIDIYQFFNGFNELLIIFGAKTKLNNKIEYYLNNDILKYKQYRQVEDKILETEKNICDFYKEEFSLIKLENFMKICFENTNISVPATSVDAIFVGDYENSYFSENKNLYVLGMDSNSFPHLKPDIGLFTDKELEKLEKNSKIEPKLKDANKLNYYKAFQSLLNFTDKICISYSITDDKGSKQFPSNLFKNALNRFLYLGENIKVLKTTLDILESFEDDEILNLLSLKINSKSDYLKRYFVLENCKEKNIIKHILTHYYKIDENILNYEINFENIEKLDKIDENLVKTNYFSASSLENYFVCPNKFLYNNLFKLKKFEPIKLDAKTLGNIVHNCCYSLAQQIFKNKKESLKNTNNEDALKNEYAIDYDKIISDVLHKSEFKTLFYIQNSKEILNNLTLEIKKLFEFIINQQKNSEFLLSKAEYKFEYEINGIKFKGYVDRIDENENEFVVIDYKTGNTKIEYGDIVFGKKVQLILYAKILEKILNKKCVGIYYLSINDDFSTKDKMKIYLNGITKNTNNVLHKLDGSLNVEKSLESNYFEFQDKYLLNNTQFENVLNKTMEKVLENIKLIQKGKFSASPLILNEFNSCEYCDFSEICKYKCERREILSEDLIERLLNE